MNCPKGGKERPSIHENNYNNYYRTALILILKAFGIFSLTR